MKILVSPVNSGDSRDDEDYENYELARDEPETNHHTSKIDKTTTQRKFYSRMGSKPWDELIYDVEELNDFYDDIEKETGSHPSALPRLGYASVLPIRKTFSAISQKNASVRGYRGIPLDDSSFSAAECLGCEERENNDTQIVTFSPQNKDISLINFTDSLEEKDGSNFVQNKNQEGNDRNFDGGTTSYDYDNWRKNTFSQHKFQQNNGKELNIYANYDYNSSVSHPSCEGYNKTKEQLSDVSNYDQNSKRNINESLFNKFNDEKERKYKFEDCSNTADENFNKHFVNHESGATKKNAGINLKLSDHLDEHKRNNLTNEIFRGNKNTKLQVDKPGEKLGKGGGKLPVGLQNDNESEGKTLTETGYKNENRTVSGSVNAKLLENIELNAEIDEENDGNNSSGESYTSEKSNSSGESYTSEESKSSGEGYTSEGSSFSGESYSEGSNFSGESYSCERSFQPENNTSKFTVQKEADEDFNIQKNNNKSEVTPSTSEIYNDQANSSSGSDYSDESYSFLNQAQQIGSYPKDLTNNTSKFRVRKEADEDFNIKKNNESEVTRYTGETYNDQANSSSGSDYSDESYSFLNQTQQIGSNPQDLSWNQINLYEENFEYQDVVDIPDPEPLLEEDSESDQFSDESYCDTKHIAIADLHNDNILDAELYSKAFDFKPAQESVPNNVDRQVPISSRPPLNPRKKEDNDVWKISELFTSTSSDVKQKKEKAIYNDPPPYSLQHESENAHETDVLRQESFLSTSSTSAVVDYRFDLNALDIKEKSYSKYHRDIKKVQNSNLVANPVAISRENIDSNQKVSDMRGVENKKRLILKDQEVEASGMNGKSKTKLKEEKKARIALSSYSDDSKQKKRILVEGHALHTHTQYENTGKNTVSEKILKEESNSYSIGSPKSIIQKSIPDTKYFVAVKKNKNTSSPMKTLPPMIPLLERNFDSRTVSTTSTELFTYSSSSSEDLANRNDATYNKNQNIRKHLLFKLPSSIFEESSWINDNGQKLAITKDRQVDEDNKHDYRFNLNKKKAFEDKKQDFKQRTYSKNILNEEGSYGQNSMPENNSDTSSCESADKLTLQNDEYSVISKHSEINVQDYSEDNDLDTILNDFSSISIAAKNVSPTEKKLEGFLQKDQDQTNNFVLPEGQSYNSPQSQIIHRGITENSEEAVMDKIQSFLEPPSSPLLFGIEDISVLGNKISRDTSEMEHLNTSEHTKNINETSKSTDTPTLLPRENNEMSGHLSSGISVKVQVEKSFSSDSSSVTYQHEELQSKPDSFESDRHLLKPSEGTQLTEQVTSIRSTKIRTEEILSDQDRLDHEIVYQQAGTIQSIDLSLDISSDAGSNLRAFENDTISVHEVPEDVYTIDDIEVIEVMEPESPWVKRRGLTRGLGKMRHTVAMVAQSLERNDSWMENRKVLLAMKTFARNSPVVFSAPSKKSNLLLRTRSHLESANLLTIGERVGVGDHTLVRESTASRRKIKKSAFNRKKEPSHSECCIIS